MKYIILIICICGSLIIACVHKKTQSQSNSSLYEKSICTDSSQNPRLQNQSQHFERITNFDTSSDCNPFPIEAGVWFNIKYAPQPSGYYLIDNKIYALEPDKPGAFNNYNSLRDSLIKYISHNNYKPVNNVDVSSFEVCINIDEKRYAKDVNYVYFPKHYELIEYARDNNSFTAIEYGQNLIIPDADPKTFIYIGRGYAVDHKNMYLDGQKIKWSDSIISLFFDFHRTGIYY